MKLDREHLRNGAPRPLPGAEAVADQPPASPLIAPEAFVHVPHLAGKIVDPAASRFRLSRAAFEQWDARAQEAGYPPGWRRSHEEREATRAQALQGRLDRDLWLFAYGSLMWDPALRIAEIRTATLMGLHRRFCLKIEIGRGSRAKPGLMAGLDQGGTCHGLAFRVPAAAVDPETEILWMREMIRAAYVPIFRSVETPQGPVEALTFAMDRSSPLYADLSLDEAARLIATAEGILGSNREYVDRLAAHLALLGIEDYVLDAVRRRLPPAAPPANAAGSP